MRRILLSLVLVLVASVPPLAAQQGGRALTLEDYYSLNNVGSPRISPAGDWVAYTVSHAIEQTNGTETETWIVRANGSGDPVLVQRNGRDVAQPTWCGPRPTAHRWSTPTSGRGSGGRQPSRPVWKA